ncbi:MAG: hypothetical protein ABWZ83_14095, partial [Mesorhizobium sp.]
FRATCIKRRYAVAAESHSARRALGRVRNQTAQGHIKPHPLKETPGRDNPVATLSLRPSERFISKEGIDEPLQIVA